MAKKSVIKRKKGRNNWLIALALAIVVAVIFYKGAEMKAQSTIQPVSIPFAKDTLMEHSIITKDDIFLREVPAKSVPPDVVRNPNELVGMYVQTEHTIPKNSMFFKTAITEFENIPSRISMILPPDHLGLPVPVNLEKSVANSLEPGMEVQVRFYTENTPSGQPLEGVLEERLKVLALRDNQGKDAQGVELPDQREKEKDPEVKYKVPTIMVFEVDSKQASYLIRAKELGELNILAVSEEKEEQNSENPSVTTEEKQVNTEDINDLINRLKPQLTEKDRETLQQILEKQEKEEAGKPYQGNKIKLFIDTMTYDLEQYFTENIYITPEGEVVYFDIYQGKLLYFETRKEFKQSQYVLEKLTEEKIQELKAKGVLTSEDIEKIEQIKKHHTLDLQNNENSEEEEENRFEGEGKGVSEKVFLDKGIAVLQAKHTGEQEFEVNLVDINGEKKTVIRQKQGQFDGEVAIGIPEDGYYIFDVVANGKWELEIKPNEE